MTLVRPLLVTLMRKIWRREKTFPSSARTLEAAKRVLYDEKPLFARLSLSASPKNP